MPGDISQSFGGEKRNPDNFRVKPGILYHLDHELSNFTDNFKVSRLHEV